MMHRVLYVVLSFGLIAAVACGSRDEVRGERHDERATLSVPPRSAVSRAPRVVILGDSLTAGFGLGMDEAFPALLERRIKAQGLSYQIVNAGVSGDTSAGGLS